jgi:spermidine synthase
VLISAAVVGFVFFLMELVWYRMLAPLLGGSSYTFGLILAVALTGIGAGGLLYGSGARSRRPTLLSFSTTCALEALFLIVPFALGDKLAVAALVLRDLVGLGFFGLVLSWSVVVSVVVLPAAVIAGYQFPLLVAVLGSGRQSVGKEVGRTYAWNTGGAILGSLAGGFGLIPLLTATGAWRLVTVLLVGLAMTTAWLGTRKRSKAGLTVPAVLSLLALLLSGTQGPTAFWRHSPIGAGRLHIRLTDQNQLTEEIHRKNRAILWQADGRESSLALLSIDGAAFMISGKVDGHARQDASTQVMSGLIGLALHPDPRLALVIGLGTGSTAGWMAEVPSLERVDVVELEPDIARVAKDCADVNQQAMENPKVRLIIGDGREILLTSPERYDFVFSEPSNPYRAGIASLFTLDFYEAVAERLDEDGIFIQWLQGYEIDGQIVRTALATLGSAFDAVEIWRTNPSDLMLIASKHPIRHDPDRLQQLLKTDPFKTAMNRVWGVEGVEGFYAGFIANDDLTRAILNQEQRWINTDDRPIIEFGFARNVGRSGLFKIEELIQLAQRRAEDHPRLQMPTAIDRNRLLELRGVRALSSGKSPKMPQGVPEEQRHRTHARQQFAKEDLAGTCASWHLQTREPDTPMDLLMMAECRAETNDPSTLPLVEALDQQGRSVEADAIRARWQLRQGELEQAARSEIDPFEGYRSDPWPYPATMKRLLSLAVEIVSFDPDLGPDIFASLQASFSVQLQNELRRATLFDIAQLTDFDEYCLEVLEAYGPWVPWKERFLTERLECLESKDPSAAAQARQDLGRYLSVAPFRLETGLEADE